MAGAALAEVDLAGLRPEIVAEWERHRDVLLRDEMPSLGEGPLTGYFLPEMTTLADYLPPDALVIVDEPGAVRLAVNQLAAQAEELREAFTTGGELPHNTRVPYLGWEAVRERLAARSRLEIGAWEETPDDDNERFVADVLGFGSAPAFGGRMDRAIEAIRAATLPPIPLRVVIATDQDARLRELLSDADLYPMARTNAPKNTGTGKNSGRFCGPDTASRGVD